MPTVVDATYVNPVGNVNTNTSPPTIAAPSGLAAGDLLVVAPFFAQGNGVTTAITTPANMTKASTDLSGSRAGAVFYAKVTDPATFSGGISLHSAATTTRVSAVAVAYRPDSGYEWDTSTVIWATTEYNGTAGATSDTFPTLATRDLMLGIVMSNKSASATYTTHTGNGTDTRQTTALASPGTGSVSDSATSITVGGSSVTFSPAQANNQAYRFGISQVATGGGSLERTATGSLTLSGTATVSSNIPLPTVTGLK